MLKFSDIDEIIQFPKIKHKKVRGSKCPNYKNIHFQNLLNLGHINQICAEIY